MLRCILFFALALSPVAGLAQESAHFKIEEHAFNAAGRPIDGNFAQSAHFQITLDALGDALLGASSGSTYSIDGGLFSAYRPPAEVRNLHFVEKTTLVWDPEPSRGVYNLYRDLVRALAGGSYGSCREEGVTDESAQDNETPPPADAFFYLVTALNRLDEEGSMGSDSGGATRPNTNPCP